MKVTNFKRSFFLFDKIGKNALLYEFCQFKTYGKGKTAGKKTIEEKM